MAVTVTQVIRGNTSAAGVQANSASSYTGGLSPDGTKLLFVSDATNLVAGDANGAIDAFVKDLTTGAVQCVNSSAAGVIGNNGSYAATFSADGTKVVFLSSASNLIAGDSNGVADVYVKTLATGAIERVSTSAAGAQANAISGAPVFSPDGTKVAFYSSASNLVAGDTNGATDIFVKTLATGAIERVSVSAGGVEATGDSSWPVFSGDGAKLAFLSRASNLVAGDSNGVDDIFVKTLATGAIERVNTSAAGVQGDNPADAPAFSPDGTKVAFYSSATNLVAGDTNGVSDVFVKDLTTGAIMRADTSAAGAQATGALSRYPSFSPDGTLVAFESGAANLVSGDTNAAYDVFVKNLTTGEINRISTTAAGVQGDGGSYYPVFGPGGGKLTFRSFATNLVAGDTNGVDDVFVVEVSGVSGPPVVVTPAVPLVLPTNPAAQATLIAASANDALPGDARDNSIYAGAGHDTAWGFDGRDSVWGEDGDDLLYGNNDADLLSGQSGADSLGGGPGDDSLRGGPGADELRGGQGADQLSGGQGADSLWGGRGDDTLTGGLGADRFVFGLDSGADRVEDFRPAEGDRLVLPTGAGWSVATDADGAALIRHDGGTIHLAGIAPSAVSADWFLFA